MSEYQADEDRLNALRSGDEKSWQAFYAEMRTPFRLFFLKNGAIPDNEIVELFQEALIAFHRNVMNGRLEKPLQSSLKTYLFGIGKILCRKRFSTASFSWDDDIPEEAVAPAIEAKAERQEKAAMVSKLLDRIGEPCRQLLTLVYIHGYAMESVAAEMDFPTEGAARKRKFDCLRKLRQMLS